MRRNETEFKGATFETVRGYLVGDYDILPNNSSKHAPASVIHETCLSDDTVRVGTEIDSQASQYKKRKG